jgi:hypothetical protein
MDRLAHLLLVLLHQSYGRFSRRSLSSFLTSLFSFFRAHEKCLSTNDPRIPICKHWKTKGICIFQHKCQFRHPLDSSPPSMTSASSPLSPSPRLTRTGTWNRRRIYNDGRASVLRRWLLKVFPFNYLQSGSGVLDVAGGKGEVSFEIVNLNQIQATVYDPRPLDLFRYKKKLQFGFYHRNEILECYNPFPPPPTAAPLASPVLGPLSVAVPVPISLPISVPDSGQSERQVRLPLHIRGYFQMFDSLKAGSSFPLKEQRGEQGTERGLRDETVCSLPLALQSEEEFSNQLAMARQVKWTKKGLQHEEEEEEGDGDDAKDDDQDREGESSNRSHPRPSWPSDQQMTRIRPQLIPLHDRAIFVSVIWKEGLRFSIIWRPVTLSKIALSWWACTQTRSDKVCPPSLL